MALDSAKNFSKVTVSTGYSAGATTIVLQTGHGARVPDGECNGTYFNASTYSDPADDPNREIVRKTARTDDTLTITRAQEGTTATAKNTSGKTYQIRFCPTAKLITDIQTAIDAGGGSGSSPLLHQASVTLTDAQIKAIPQALTEPIPAPGVGRITIPQSVFMSADFAIVYDDPPSDDQMKFAYFPDGTTPMNLGFFGTVNVTGGVFNWVLAAQMYGENAWITNMPIRILNFNGSDFTGGDASNTLLISIPFMVFDMSTGTYVTVAASGWDEDTRTFA